MTSIENGQSTAAERMRQNLVSLIGDYNGRSQISRDLVESNENLTCRTSVFIDSKEFKIWDSENDKFCFRVCIDPLYYLRNRVLTSTHNFLKTPLSPGTLTMHSRIYTRTKDGGAHPYLYAKELWDLTIQQFTRYWRTPEAILGWWVRSGTNYKQFELALKKSPDSNTTQAAFETWTGARARDLKYSAADVLYKPNENYTLALFHREIN